MDRIVFSCPKCNIRRKTFAEDKNKVIRCPRCKLVFQVKQGNNIAYKKAHAPKNWDEEDTKVISREDIPKIDFEDSSTGIPYNYSDEEKPPSKFDFPIDTPEKLYTQETPRQKRKQLPEFSMAKLMIGMIVISISCYYLAAYLRPDIFGNGKPMTREKVLSKLQRLMGDPEYISKAKKDTIRDVKKYAGQGVILDKETIKKMYAVYVRHYKQQHDIEKRAKEAIREY